jgi:phenylalanyl-tRNA synthetase beta chain
VVALNQRYSRDDIRAFEVGKIFRASSSGGTAIEGIVETLELAVVLGGSAEPFSWDIATRSEDIFDLRGILQRYFSRIGLPSIDFRPVDEARWGIGSPALAIYSGDEEIGRMGRIDDTLIEREKIDGAPVIAIFDLERIAPLASVENRYTAPSKFPVVGRDLSILVDASVANRDLEAAITSAGAPLLSRVTLFDLYQGKGIEPGKKSVAWSLQFTSWEGTLTDEQVATSMKAISKALGSEFNAQLRGTEDTKG